MWHFAKMETVEHLKAMDFFRRAVELDPGFAPGYAMLALAYRIETGAFRPDLRAENTARAIEYARHAIVIDPTDAKAHAVLAIAMTGSGHHAEGIAEADLAVDLDPNSVPRIPPRASHEPMEAILAKRWSPCGLRSGLAHSIR